MLKMARSRTLAARSHLCGQSAGFSCAVTVRGVWVVASCILESMTKVRFLFCVIFVLNTFTFSHSFKHVMHRIWQIKVSLNVVEDKDLSVF